MEEQNPPFEPFDSTDDPESLFAAHLASQPQLDGASADSRTIIVIGRHRYYNLFSAQLVSCSLSSTGELKAPFTVLSPLELVWRTEQPEELKFYSAVARFQSFYEKSATDTASLKALERNPLRYPYYLHDSEISEKITAKSLKPVQVTQPSIDFKVRIGLNSDMFSVTSDLFINGTYFPFSRISVRYNHFLVTDDTWYLCSNPHLPSVVAYFKKHDGELQLPHDAFLQFQREVLAKMESYVPIEHTYLKPATKAQLRSKGFNQQPENLLYLIESENYVLLQPFMRYGEIEIPLLSNKLIYDQDNMGRPFFVARNTEAEAAFTKLLIQQHPHFWEQLDNMLDYFYLHKERFLDETWFLNAFDNLAANGVTILGFNDLQDNKLNQHKATVSINVESGLNWFNVTAQVKFGSKKASLKQLKKAVVNKSKYVLLDDGTMGIIPEEWLQRLQLYFETGAVVSEEELQIPKTNFAALTELFEDYMLDEQVHKEPWWYQEQLNNVEKLAPAPIPAGLQTTLRPYQWQGLSWLNFLDDLQFGGCLADDMGLGKTVQIIALMLLLREKRERQTNLLVVPTSLIPNWQAELNKFAPSLRQLTHHGPNRAKDTAAFQEYDVVITTYNTLLSDIVFLKKYLFGYTFLDESQNIKNPNSQRYKAACLLQSRNRVVLTGTPFENNTFDIYAQLSFVNPGLLGTRTYFRNTYSMPIDKFKDRRSAQALQEKICPFVLRRTKAEVAKELPDKTEMVLYCEMGEEQRKVYDTAEQEFRDYITASGEEELTKHPMHVLRGITKLRQICNSPLLTGDAKLFSDTSAKIQVLMQQIQNVARHHKVLVFSQFVGMLDLIKNELVKENIKYSYLTGSTRNRGEVVDQFQTDEEIRVFLVSLKAGGTGLNLTAADYVFIVDPWWNPAVENQAIDRSYRIGQAKKVIAVRLICPNTVEEKIQILQQNKSKLATDLVTADNSFFQSLTKDDWLNLSSNSSNS
ncbi:SNF2 helicase associated domain-containing protein [Pontibacter sp. FD36]|uniref:DEAD/DEAH box helicase n=1 Tax=Pontibacter sp. FD36 TaxID=2789860 RepID=UPI0018AA6567|nr:DEAD/DEAH box helicase [Pontibacter sp. FD36]MBF8963550.1 SNF2 helicase associated domain-containing protein [Pontibacter sp. FD36]